MILNVLGNGSALVGVMGSVRLIGLTWIILGLWTVIGVTSVVSEGCGGSSLRKGKVVDFYASP